MNGLLTHVNTHASIASGRVGAALLLLQSRRLRRESRLGRPADTQIKGETVGQRVY